MPLSTPTLTDVQTFFASTKLNAAIVAIVLDNADVTTEIAAAERQFQIDTGFRPFLGVSSVRTFDPPGPDRSDSAFGILTGIATLGGGRKLFLGAGLLSVNSITIGVTASNPSGTVLTQGTDYWLRPNSAPDDGEPYRWIEFAYAQRGAPQSIKIDAVWGFVTTANGYPADVFRSLIRQVALQIAPQLELALTGGICSVTDDKTQVIFSRGADSPLAGQAQAWLDYYNKTVGRYSFGAGL